MSALEDLFHAKGHNLALQGGDVLIEPGEKPDAIYWLVSGRLTETATTPGGLSHIVSMRRPGDVVGAANLLTQTPARTMVTALRDSRVLRLSVERVREAADQAEIYAELAREALEEGGIGATPAPRKAALLGFISVCDTVAVRAFVETMAGAMRELGVTVAILCRDASDTSAETLSRLEDSHDFVFLCAEKGDSDFAHYLGRQIDRLVLVGATDSPLPASPFRFGALVIHRHQLLDLVILHGPESARPTDTRRWRQAAPSARVFHARRGDAEDLARLARGFAGKSIGLALSGGGARAYAHVGVVRALRELNLPIDFLAGTSMGAVVAASVAMGWDQAEMEHRLRLAFVETSPLADIAFPILALSGGHRVDRRLAEHFDDVDIEDLWRPFLCVSTDLTKAEPRLHRRGRLRDALRASISLPGVLPPVVDGAHVLVDGALMRNLPVDFLAAQHEGPNIGVDVTQHMALTPDDLELKPSPWRWFWSGAWMRGPPIVSILLRSALAPAARAMGDPGMLATVLIKPDVHGVELRDWRAFDEAVESGYRAAMDSAKALEALKP
jgi:NTE family protein